MVFDDEMMNMARELGGHWGAYMGYDYPDNSYICTDPRSPEFDATMPEETRQWIIGYYERLDAQEAEDYRGYEIKSAMCERRRKELESALIKRFKQVNGVTLKDIKATGYDIFREALDRVE